MAQCPGVVSSIDGEEPKNFYIFAIPAVGGKKALPEQNEWLMFWTLDFPLYDIWAETLALEEIEEWPEIRKYTFLKKTCQEVWPTRVGKDNEQEPYGKPYEFYEMQGSFESYPQIIDFKYRQEWRILFETELNVSVKEPLEQIKSLEQVLEDEERDTQEKWKGIYKALEEA